MNVSAMEAEEPLKKVRKGPLIMSTLHTGNDMEFNACVGRNTGSYDNSIGYADGFEKAAEMLLSSLGVRKPEISQQSWGREPLVDVLVYPICFCARHHVELSIKRMLPVAWRAYITKFPKNQKKLEPLKQPDVRHDILPVWTDLVAITKAADYRFEVLCSELQPYIVDLSYIDSTGQVFRYDTDARTSTLNLNDTSHIDLTHFANGYAQMCRILIELESLLANVIGEVQTGTFTSKLIRGQLFDIADSLPDRGVWGEDEFEAAKQKIMEQYDLSGTDFKKATQVISNTRCLSFRVGIAMPIPHLAAGVFERLQQVNPTRRQDVETLSENERSVLYGLYETGSVYAYPEGFDSYLEPRPRERDAAHYFDLAREENYLARKYASNPDRVEHALKQLGQLELLVEFRRVYEKELERVRAARETADIMDVDKIVFQYAGSDPTGPHQEVAS
ncbi:hypothetical protein [Xanthomonas pisi]|uniref:Uncharacterized protein n=1 Tax=Xanthomonas pisi TaxID=56457 RepID=A0A2S7D4Q9_9XANT|nr:hypothetical protein [Xanthomonas pisi]KLD72223.1 hypothetical protein Y887_02305 [Xanthomonas pisi DSM 18956]PPU68822.1 hypothetical protein XpiCFBP4643_07400 [Xanthomonas pisi]